MAFLSATQPLEEVALGLEYNAETQLLPAGNITLPPQQVGVLIAELEQQEEVIEYPLYLGCNIVGRAELDLPGAEEAQALRLDKWRGENPHIHVEGVFLPDGSISAEHAHIYMEDGGRNAFVVARRSRNPSKLVPGGIASHAHRLTEGVRYNVRPDDVLRFGKFSCRISAEAAGSAPPALPPLLALPAAGSGQPFAPPLPLMLGPPPQLGQPGAVGTAAAAVASGAVVAGDGRSASPGKYKLVQALSVPMAAPSATHATSSRGGEQLQQQQHARERDPGQGQGQVQGQLPHVKLEQALLMHSMGVSGGATATLGLPQYQLPHQYQQQAAYAFDPVQQCLIVTQHATPQGQRPPGAAAAGAGAEGGAAMGAPGGGGEAARGGGGDGATRAMQWANDPDSLDDSHHTNGHESQSVGVPAPSGCGSAAGWEPPRQPAHEADGHPAVGSAVDAPVPPTGHLPAEASQQRAQQQWGPGQGEQSGPPSNDSAGAVRVKQEPGTRHENEAAGPGQPQGEGVCEDGIGAGTRVPTASPPRPAAAEYGQVKGETAAALAAADDLLNGFEFFGASQLCPDLRTRPLLGRAAAAGGGGEAAATPAAGRAGAAAAWAAADGSQTGERVAPPDPAANPTAGVNEGARDAAAAAANGVEAGGADDAMNGFEFFMASQLCPNPWVGRELAERVAAAARAGKPLVALGGAGSQSGERQTPPPQAGGGGGGAGGNEGSGGGDGDDAPSDVTEPPEYEEGEDGGAVNSSAAVQAAPSPQEQAPGPSTAAQTGVSGSLGSAVKSDETQPPTQEQQAQPGSLVPAVTVPLAEVQVAPPAPVMLPTQPLDDACGAAAAGPSTAGAQARVHAPGHDSAHQMAQQNGSTAALRLPRYRPPGLPRPRAGSAPPPSLPQAAAAAIPPTLALSAGPSPPELRPPLPPRRYSDGGVSGGVPAAGQGHDRQRPPPPPSSHPPPQPQPLAQAAPQQQPLTAGALQQQPTVKLEALEATRQAGPGPVGPNADDEAALEEGAVRPLLMGLLSHHSPGTSQEPDPAAANAAVVRPLGEGAASRGPPLGADQVQQGLEQEQPLRRVVEEATAQPQGAQAPVHAASPQAEAAPVALPPTQQEPPPHPSPPLETMPNAASPPESNGAAAASGPGPSAAPGPGPAAAGVVQSSGSEEAWDLGFARGRVNNLVSLLGSSGLSQPASESQSRSKTPGLFPGLGMGLWLGGLRPAAADAPAGPGAAFGPGPELGPGPGAPVARAAVATHGPGPVARDSTPMSVLRPSDAVAGAAAASGATAATARAQGTAAGAEAAAVVQPQRAQRGPRRSSREPSPAGAREASGAPPALPPLQPKHQQEEQHPRGLAATRQQPEKTPLEQRPAAPGPIAGLATTGRPSEAAAAGDTPSETKPQNRQLRKPSVSFQEPPAPLPAAAAAAGSAGPLPGGFGSPTTSVRSFLPGLGTQIAADALQDLMAAADSVPAETPDGSEGAAEALRVARTAALPVAGGVDEDLPDDDDGGGGRRRRGAKRGDDDGDDDYVFPGTQALQEEDDDPDTPPVRGRGRGRGARGRGRGAGRGARGRGAKAVPAAKPPPGPGAASRKRRATGPEGVLGAAAGAVAPVPADAMPPPAKRVKRRSREPSPAPVDELQQQQQHQQQQQPVVAAQQHGPAPSPPLQWATRRPRTVLSREGSAEPPPQEVAAAPEVPNGHTHGAAAAAKEAVAAAGGEPATGPAAAPMEIDAAGPLAGVAGAAGHAVPVGRSAAAAQADVPAACGAAGTGAGDLSAGPPHVGGVQTTATDAAAAVCTGMPERLRAAQLAPASGQAGGSGGPAADAVREGAVGGVVPSGGSLPGSHEAGGTQPSHGSPPVPRPKRQRGHPPGPSQQQGASQPLPQQEAQQAGTQGRQQEHVQVQPQQEQEQAQAEQRPQQQGRPQDQRPQAQEQQQQQPEQAQEQQRAPQPMMEREPLNVTGQQQQQPQAHARSRPPTGRAAKRPRESPSAPAAADAAGTDAAAAPAAHTSQAPAAATPPPAEGAPEGAHTAAPHTAEPPTADEAPAPKRGRKSRASTAGAGKGAAAKAPAVKADPCPAQDPHAHDAAPLPTPGGGDGSQAPSATSPRSGDGGAAAGRRRRGSAAAASAPAEGGGGGGGVVVSISRNIPERERNHLAATVTRLGGRVAEDEAAGAGGFTHLLLARDNFKTSMKVLAALAAGRPLLDAAWLRACSAAGRWLEPAAEHAAVDPKAERANRFKIRAAYEAVQRSGPMLQGLSFYATPLRAEEDASMAASAPTGSTARGSRGRASSGGRASIGGAGADAAADPSAPQGLALIAQLAGAKVLSDVREVGSTTVVLGMRSEHRWAKQHLPIKTKVYDKDGFVNALLHQSFQDVKPVFVV